TPAINSRIVRPREIRAINNPINGAQDICHAQKKMVFLPNHSFPENGFNVKLIGIKLEIYPPTVVTKLSAINSVGPTMSRNMSRSPATHTLILLKIRIPLSSPLDAETIKSTDTII